jgi:hypothetical protein
LKEAKKEKKKSEQTCDIKLEQIYFSIGKKHLISMPSISNMMSITVCEALPIVARRLGRSITADIGSIM